MKLPLRGRTLALGAVVAALLAMLAFVGLRSGPLARVPVTVASVESRAVAPSIFGTGTVEARYAYRIGPIVSGRVKRVQVQVGDRVRAADLLAEMDPVDLDERMRGQDAAVRRAQAASVASASQLEDAKARRGHAEAQRLRYEQLLAAGMVTAEMAGARRQDHEVAKANFDAVRANGEAALEDLSRQRSEREALARQRANLRLVAPVDGLVTARDAEAGTTVVAGQSVVEIVEPASVWIAARFDQSSARGLAAGLPAAITLRSRPGERLAGRVLRVEPRADAVTEEILAKVAIDAAIESLPPLGEWAEVTVILPVGRAAPVVPNASVQRSEGQTGVWVVEGGGPRFKPVKLGAMDVEGRVQVLEGLAVNERVVVYSQRALGNRSRIEVVERLPDAPP